MSSRISTDDETGGGLFHVANVSMGGAPIEVSDGAERGRRASVCTVNMDGYAGGVGIGGVSGRWAYHRTESRTEHA